jgi:hypothetical protein
LVFGIVLQPCRLGEQNALQLVGQRLQRARVRRQRHEVVRLGAHRPRRAHLGARAQLFGELDQLLEAGLGRLGFVLKRGAALLVGRALDGAQGVARRRVFLTQRPGPGIAFVQGLGGADARGGQ